MGVEHPAPASRPPKGEVHAIAVSGGDGDRDGIGGHPWLRDGVWPACSCDRVVTADGPARCRRFGLPMAHFLRFDVRAEFGLPFPVGAHFSLFLCPACADAFIPPSGRPPHRLPERFWEGGERVQAMEADTNATNFGWWYASLEPPGAPLVRSPRAEPNVLPRRLAFAKGRERGFHVGGRPAWRQGRESYVCACGATLAFLVQLPGELRFSVAPDSPPQAGVTWSPGRPWAVFLGNDVIVLACPNGCNPRAIVPVNQ